MNPAPRPPRHAPLLAALALLAGCATPPPAQLCMERLMAICAKEASCRNDQRAPDCVTARKNDCVTQPDRVLCADGKLSDPARAASCSAALSTTSCQELNNGDQPADCFDACS